MKQKVFGNIYLFYSIYNIWATGVNFHYWARLKQFETISSPTSSLLSVMYMSFFSHAHLWWAGSTESTHRQLQKVIFISSSCLFHNWAQVCEVVLNLRHVVLEVWPIQPQPLTLLQGIRQSHPQEGNLGELSHHSLDEVLRMRRHFEDRHPACWCFLQCRVIFSESKLVCLLGWP